MSLHIAVISDARLFCETIARILSQDSDVSVTTYFEGVVPREFYDQRPDVALADARMPDVIQLCSDIVVNGGPPVVLVNSPDDDTWAEAALARGIRGIVVKSAAPEEVTKAVQIVHEGGIWARRRWLNLRVQHAVTVRSRRSLGTPVDVSGLSPRELEVLHYAAMGVGNRELAKRLAISEATVKVHLTHIFQKLGVSRRTELAAVYHGLRATARRRGDTDISRLIN